MLFFVNFPNPFCCQLCGLFVMLTVSSTHFLALLPRCSSLCFPYPWNCFPSVLLVRLRPGSMVVLNDLIIFQSLSSEVKSSAFASLLWVCMNEVDRFCCHYLLERIVHAGFYVCMRLGRAEREGKFSFVFEVILHIITILLQLEIGRDL